MSYIRMLAPVEELSNYEIAFVFIAFPHGTVPIKRTTYKKVIKIL